MFKNGLSAIRAINEITFHIKIRLLNRLHCVMFFCGSVEPANLSSSHMMLAAVPRLYLAAFLNELLSLWSV